MNHYSLRERISYWFDNRMAKGSLALIRLLVSVTVILLVFLASAVYLSARDELTLFESFFDTMSTIINAWMPSSGDSDNHKYLLFMSLAAVAGLLITSVLIGIISSAIEEKIYSLRKGNSLVLEKDHYVVLGFYPGEYTLINQLILAASGRPCTIVIAGNMERDEMESNIHDNLTIPPNVRIICRTADICDPAGLEKLALTDCRTILISPTDDNTTVKALLAVSTIINNNENNVRVGAIISKDEYRFPPSIAAKHNVTTLQTNDTIAKIIAHSCTQAGLSETFREVFNFEGNELYSVPVAGIQGYTFDHLTAIMDYAVPAGIQRNGRILLNPRADTLIEENDNILVFTEDRTAPRVRLDLPEPEPMPAIRKKDLKEDDNTVVIIGSNDTLDTVLYELPDNVTEVIIAHRGDYPKDTLIRIGNERAFSVTFYETSLSTEEGLFHLVKDAEHVVILCSHEDDEDKADMQTVFLLLHLRDIRTRYQLSFNITAEMRREANQHLIVTDDHTDFVVASDMSSLFLAQLAESPELADVFREVLSNNGNELYLKKAGDLYCTGEHSVADLRRIALQQEYILLGYMNGDTSESTFNPPLSATITLRDKDSVIVLGES